MADSDLQQPEPGDVAPVPSGSRSRHTRQSRAGLPWHWLGIAFLGVLIMAAVIYVVRGMPAAPPEVVELTATPAEVGPTATPRRGPPTATPTPGTPTATPEPESPAVEAEIAVGVQVRVTGTSAAGLSFRSGPGVNYARLKTVYDGEIFAVLEGPEEANGYRWWRLEDKEGTVGWGADAWLEVTGE